MTSSDLSSRSKRETTCRSCGSPKLHSFLDLGTTPLADRLRNATDEPEPRFKLETALCEDCALVQILDTVDPEVLFADEYPYYSSFSPALLAHSRDHALARMADRNLGPDSLVIELASNDGYLLKNYVENGIPVLGIDPADGPVKAANAIGVPTECAFFGLEYAQALAAKGVAADVIHGNNVLAHVADTNGFVAGIAALLKPNGVAVIEAPYLKALIDHCEFDTIYHEHLCYFSATALDHLFRRHGLYFNHVELLPIHGGSLRIFVEKVEAPRDTITALLAEEKAAGLDRIDYFADFARRVNALRDAVNAKLAELKAQGASIAAYGAAAKGATFVNYFGIGADTLDFVVDRNVHKQGKYMPGGAIKVLDPSALLEHKPDYVLILAWNFATEILQQQSEYRAAGGKFIIPIPTLEIV